MTGNVGIDVQDDVGQERTCWVNEKGEGRGYHVPRWTSRAGTSIQQAEPVVGGACCVADMFDEVGL